METETPELVLPSLGGEQKKLKKILKTFFPSPDVNSSDFQVDRGVSEGLSVDMT
jgi:hypothetical protein